MLTTHVLLSRVDAIVCYFVLDEFNEPNFVQNVDVVHDLPYHV